MKTVTAYECSFCDLLSKDKLEVYSHETGCMLNSLFIKNKHKEQNEAKKYLDSFRHKTSNINQLFDMIEKEQDEIIEAIKVLEFYRQNKKIIPINNITYSHHGFDKPDKPAPHSMSHSCPVDKKTVPMYPKSVNEEQPLAFEIEIFYELDKNYKEKNRNAEHVNILDFIAGINTGGGGSWTNGFHYYSTFWIEDFPLGITEF